MTDANRRKELEALAASFNQPGGNVPVTELAEYLRLLRDLRIRESENVTAYGGKYLQQLEAKLEEEELWLVYEQVAIAALDCRAMDLAVKLVQKIRKRFPKSSKTHRLTCIYLEACGEYAKLADYQKTALEEDEQNDTLFKRQVALARSKGNLSMAIELLRKHVDVFMLDKMAWEELGELYLQASLYQQAAHCYEELLMHTPSCIAYYVQYADVMYTLGGTHASGHRAEAVASDYRTAQSYYAAAVHMSKGSNLRALYGLCAATSQLAGLKVRNTQDTSSLAGLAAKSLIRQYTEENEGLLPYVKDLLKCHNL